MSRPTIKDVAAAAGVSLGSASRVLNLQPNVDPDIRVRVENAMATLGFEPDGIAQGMRRGDTKTVGVIVRDIMIPSLAGFVRATQDELFDAGYAQLIAFSDNRKDRELHLLKLFERRRVDGLIMLSSSETDSELLQARQTYPAPIVLLDRTTPETLDSVMVQHRGSMKKAVSYLLGMGHERIGLVTGPIGVFPATERVEGYHDAYKQVGRTPDPDMIRARSFSDEVSFIEVANLLSLPKPPTAIVIGGIAMLVGALRALRSHNLHVPQDISLIAAGDSDLMVLFDPPITTIRWSYAELGRISVRLLLDRIKDPKLPARRITLPTEFMIRDSCAPPSPERKKPR